MNKFDEIKSRRDLIQSISSRQCCEDRQWLIDQLEKAEIILRDYANSLNWRHSGSRDLRDLWFPWESGFEPAIRYFEECDRGQKSEGA